MKMRIGLVITAALLLAEAAAGQTAPAGWTVRLDGGHPPDSAFSYVTMAPGWHVTAGKSAGILYDAGWRATGNYRVELSAFVFPNSAPAEGLGLFFAGERLDGPDQSYFYLLIRPDGRFIVKHRAGAETHTLVPWTASDAVIRPGEKPVEQVLAVEVGPAEVTFSINGRTVQTFPRKQMGALGGQAGLRVNHGVNLHLTEIKVVPAG
jgi:hypothetical protein